MSNEPPRHQNTPYPLPLTPYLNPVYPHDFPDPFVLKHGNDFWAYGTGFWHDGRCFGILHSRDLVHWEAKSGALEPLPGHHSCYWAPEVTYLHGRFYLYYSVGNETRMEIRVATSDRPEGPFIDSGNRLTPELFAIDAHVASDPAGNRYLFYATDFLNHSHVGTGTVRARMSDPFTLAEPAVPVTRARYDWQVYDPRRKEKGGVRWHTIEGPFVVRHKDLYYQMFSGGNWQNPGYGVSYATTATLHNPEEWEQHADGERITPLLRSDPEQGIIGPGHNSVVRGPDNRQLYCVYHRWAADGSGRRMAIDRLDWAGERMVLTGPSATPQAAPILPSISGFGNEHWRFEGEDWDLSEQRVTRRAIGTMAAAECNPGSNYFLFECLFRADSPATGASHLIIDLLGSEETQLRVAIQPQTQTFQVTILNQQGTATITFPPGSDLSADHRLRVDVNNLWVIFSVDDTDIWQGSLASPAQVLRIAITNTNITLLQPSVTIGWEDLWQTSGNPAHIGWRALPATTSTHWHISDGTLHHTANTQPSTLIKGDLHTAYEWLIALRLPGATTGTGVTLAPAWHPANAGPQLQLTRDSNRWIAQWQDQPGHSTIHPPTALDPTQFQLLRFRKQGGRLTLQWEAQLLADIACPPTPTCIAITTDSHLTIDTQRVTAIRNGQLLTDKG